MTKRALIFFGLFLAACSSTITPLPDPGSGTKPVIQPPVTKPTRPAGSPDVFVLAISGKCFFDDNGIPCFNITPSQLVSQNTKNNYDYLFTKGTTTAVAKRISNLGYSVGFKGFAASLFDRENKGTGVLKNHPGFLSLYNFITLIYDNYIKNVSNPSKIVLLAHSHGVVFSHLLTKIKPEIPIELQIDLDGVCAYWATDNDGDFLSSGNPLGDIGYEICKLQQPANGGKREDIQNVVFPNVKWNVEVQASPVNASVVHDAFDNHRLDETTGSDAGIFSLQTNLDHGAVSEPGKAGIDFVLELTSIFFKK